jgi:hypothetical protein
MHIFSVGTGRRGYNIWLNHLSGCNERIGKRVEDTKKSKNDGPWSLKLFKEGGKSSRKLFSVLPSRIFLCEPRNTWYQRFLHRCATRKKKRLENAGFLSLTSLFYWWTKWKSSMYSAVWNLQVVVRIQTPNLAWDT